MDVFMVKTQNSLVQERARKGFSFIEYMVLSVAVIMGIVAMANLFRSILLGRNRSAVISVFGEVTAEDISGGGGPSKGVIQISSD